MLFLSGALAAALLFNRQEIREQTPETAAVKPETPVQNQQPSILEEQVSQINEALPEMPAAETENPVTGKKSAVIPTTNLPVSQTVNQTVNAPAGNSPTIVADGKTQAELNSSLNNWISATNNRNVDKQMNYYAPQVDAFYLSRKASIKDVRDEKKRVFDGVEAVDIQAGKPNIKVSRDGKTATMLFRKKYSIKKDGENRTGEVLQEMKWVKTKKGWRIVGERDVKVLN